MLFEDIRYALRQFARAPGFTVTAILTLALGIGATTAIFTLVNAVLLKSLPVTKPEDLVRVGDTENCCINGGMQDDWSLFSYEQYKEFRDNTPGFSMLAAFQAGINQMAVRRQGSNHPAEAMLGEFVSGNAFESFGLSAYEGRLLRNADDSKGAPPVAVMSYRIWQQKFGSDPSIVGASFLVNGEPVTIVGITPPGFYGERLASNPASLWFPLNSEPLLMSTRSVLERPELDWLNVIGRVKTGTSRKEMEARMQVELRQFLDSPLAKVDARAKILIPKQTLHLAPGGSGVQRMQDEYKNGLHLLMWISAFVLLIACANLANLMLVRATTRKQQTSVRAALGAPRGMLVRQALTESVVLAVLGGIAGLMVAYGGARLILHLAEGKNYVPIDATPSPEVLAFAFAVSLITGVLFGVAPAWMTAHADPIEALRGANRSTKHSGLWTQKALVVIQAAVSLVLLCAAGLLIQSLRNMQHQHFGFDTANRYIVHIDPLTAGYKPEQLEAFYRQLHDTLIEIPGMKSAAFSLYSPMEGDNWGEGVFIEGKPLPAPGSHDGGASWLRASAGYFDTIGTKMLAGRGITEQDTASTRAVAVINQAFAKHFFKDENPIGKHFGDIDPKYAGSYEIVGVTEDTNYWSATGYWGSKDGKHPMFFLPATQWMKYTEPGAVQFEDVSHYLTAIELQTAGPLPGFEAQVRHTLAQINPNLTVIDFQTFGEQVEGQFSQQEMIVKLTSLFGFLALILASIGLYGVTSYAVAQRTGEIGIRMALGADRVNVLQLVLRSAFLQVAIGLAIGIPTTILAGHFMSSLLYGIKIWDPSILAITALVLAAAAFVAAVVPARRAASIEPMRALRTD
ncbi:ABC transporter permease [Paracidobacterium acidisoli]|uniref:Permease n=1 Tax=Paracidobacterium acidisoli TaxID=2303751 RepID=A0A372ILC1_9BACT|nr:ABC transporter permease [Paracidobacterium acidisoli]MBT9332263.1 ABC transporter permease [Paracidobacterium acidisoli]